MEPAFGVHAGHVAAEATWLLSRENTQTAWAQVIGQEKELFVSLGLYHLGLGKDQVFVFYLRFGKEQVLFQNNESTSQAFLGFWWVHPLVNDPFSQAMVKYLPQHHCDFCCTCAYLLLLPITIQCQRREERGVNPWQGSAVIPWSMCEAVAFWWSKQAHAPQMTMLNNVWSPPLPLY